MASRLLLGDCLDQMPGIASRSIDLILCDLPQARTRCSWDTIIPFEPLWAEYRRLIKPDGVIALFATQPFTSQLICSNLPWFRYTWVWEKSKATGWLNCKRRPMVAHEEIVIFSPRAPRYYPVMREGEPYNKGLAKAPPEDNLYNDYERVVVKSEDGKRYPRSVLYFKTAESEGEVYHRTQKPLSILEYFLQTYTQPGALVLDNAMGSGSTGVSCAQWDREFIGIEKDERYYQIARRRIDDQGA
jgi:site-specific DNA-methyltransferase (adenine-specific)